MRNLLKRKQSCTVVVLYTSGPLHKTKIQVYQRPIHINALIHLLRNPTHSTPRDAQAQSLKIDVPDLLTA